MRIQARSRSRCAICVGLGNRRAHLFARPSRVYGAHLPRCDAFRRRSLHETDNGCLGFGGGNRPSSPHYGHSRKPPGSAQLGGFRSFVAISAKGEVAPIAVIGKTERVCALSREDRFKSRPAIFLPGN
jgi:hypothetical protein